MREILEEAQELMQETGERLTEAEWVRLEGKIASSRGADAIEGKQHYRATLDVAPQHSARAWALRAALSLARHLHQRGQTCQAREALTPITRSFTEGVDTPGLREAHLFLS